ncbi:MAG: hypothetical protein FWC73_06555 [Defluviitaleaceae bacterium]|nr:hypothetical protein [Defluviitaleaceae bacterium]
MKNKDAKMIKKPQYLRILVLLSMLAIATVVAALALDSYYTDYEIDSYIGFSDYIWDEGYIGYAPYGYDYENQNNYYAGHDYLYDYPAGNIDYYEYAYEYGGYIGYAPDYYYSWYDENIHDYGLEYYYVKSCDCHGYVRRDISPYGQHDWFAGISEAGVQAYGGYIGIAPLSTPTLPVTPPIPTTIVNTPNVVTNIPQLNAEITWIQNNGTSANAYRIRLQFPGNVLNINSGAGGVAFGPILGSRHIILDANDGAPNQVWNNNVANQRHITINNPGVTVELRNVTLSRNPSLTSNGGGVYLPAGRFIMNHPEATIRYNRAQMGGGIYIPTRAGLNPSIWLQIKSGIIEDNRATIRGGGIYADGMSRNIYIVITGGRVRNNVADVLGGGIGYCCRVTMWVTDGVYIYDNVSSSGGGIYNGFGHSDMRPNHLFMLGGEIHNNTAIMNGGGIHNGTHGTAFTIVSGDIRYNRAVSTADDAGNGGGIYVNSGQATFYGGSIYYNHASGNGGGIFLEGGVGSNIRFDITYPLTIYGNRARLDGGGIRIGGGGTINNTSNTHFTVCDLVTISNNTAGRNGGGIFTQGTRHTILRGTISDNGHPQSVYIAGGFQTVTALNITQTNINTHSGGGVHVGLMGTLRVYYGYIIDNEALGTGAANGHGGGISVDGGSLLFEGQDPSTVANITKNKARMGGGIHLNTTMFQGVSLTANNTSLVNIIDNDALHDGGGISMSLTLSSQVSINEHWVISENIAGHNGGGVYIHGVSGTPQFHMTGSNINENTAGHSGGGVYMRVASGTPQFNMNSGNINENEAGHSGGGVYMRGVGGTPQFNMNGGNILDNDALGIGLGADAGGGGVFVGGSIVFTMNPGSLIAYNDAYTGGGVRVLGRGPAGINAFFRPEFIMHGGTIRDNTALAENLTGHGGGGVEIQTTGGPAMGSDHRTVMFTMHDGEIIDNTSYSSGGGVNVNNASVFNMINGVISGNTARQGGGIFVNSLPWTNDFVWPPVTHLPVVITGGEITYNQATTTPTAQYTPRVVDPVTGAVTPGVYNGSGGGIYVIKDGHITIANADITNNHAYEMGGGIFTEWYQYDVATLTEADVYTNLTIANSVTFEYNTAGQGDFLPPTNAYTWTGIPGLAQAGTQSIHDHPINNYDINFRREAVTTIPFAFHKTTSNVYTTPNLVNIADITPFLLEGAYFSLFRFEGSGTPPTTVIYPSADWERVYYDVRSTGLLANPITMELTPDGIYHLVEILAPSGFQTPFGQWRITHDDNAPGEFVIVTVGGSAPSFEYLDGYFYVGNMPDFELPLTGGFVNNRLLWSGALLLFVGFGMWGVNFIRTTKKS